MPKKVFTGDQQYVVEDIIRWLRRNSDEYAKIDVIVELIEN